MLTWACVLLDAKHAGPFLTSQTARSRGLPLGTDPVTDRDFPALAAP
jgi:hypothetical protein